ncbi:MAG: hypothetical protein UW79_C0006G0009 [Candidatus Yanofskybacteria bacterium GW2011_GWA2_44_9]|uniref:Uncharacterized protein n=1 Tax=Candidatus Yanofskybacteria bacterium GW2011_GWA2_44_9 TaxID=1619025 RepID=A0A0G1KFA4_9BACT|nr:MAG: hypothetical protein UW79_C0006G0009 [Candidatus Yanofskybacteria bacterium GW2011_GWA2_44_9]
MSLKHELQQEWQRIPSLQRFGIIVVSGFYVGLCLIIAGFVIWHLVSGM